MITMRDFVQPQMTPEASKIVLKSFEDARIAQGEMLEKARALGDIE